MKTLEKRIRLLEKKTVVNMEPPPIFFIVPRGEDSGAEDTGAIAIIPGIPGQIDGLTINQEEHETYTEFEARARETRAEHYK